MKKLIRKLLMAFIWGIGKILPVNPQKIVFTNFYGKGYGDNPKAIAEELIKKAPGYRLIWMTDDTSCEFPPEIQRVPYSSFRRIYHLCTAKVWIDNCRKGARYKKKGQLYIQTWHGFALKRIEGDVVGALPQSYESYARRDSDQIDLILSDSCHMTEVYRRAFWYKGEILESGSPRNDILLRHDEKLKEKVYRCFSIPTHKKMILYAPTFRKDHSLSCYQLNVSELLETLKSKFGESFVFVYRLHPALSGLGKELYHHPFAVNAENYPDIQELFVAADVLLTDYSSVMFDYMLTRKPCFLFAVDIDRYREDRNFYFDLNALPFTVSENQNALHTAIAQFEEKNYLERIQRFIVQTGMKTVGNASGECVKWILKHQ